MHTATRLFLRLVDRVRRLNPRAHLCGYGLYAPLNDALLRRAGCRDGDRRRIRAGAGGPGAAAERQGEWLRQPSRWSRWRASSSWCPTAAGLPPLGAYAQLVTERTARGAWATPRPAAAASICAGIARWCRCIGGVFRVVQPDVVLEDIRQQVAAGAEHITFGDPDFFNGPGHAMRDCGGAAPRVAAR